MSYRVKSRAVAMTALVSFLAVAVCAAEADAPDPSRDPLQGVWRGRDTGNLRSRWTLRVKGREFRFEGPGPQEWYEGTVMLHDTSPGGIDLEIARCDCTYKGSKSLGLYAVDGDGLTFIGAEPGYPRPEALETGGRTLLMNLRRLE